MQLTRAVLTLALAATTASALPTGGWKAGDCLNGQEANEGSINGISDATAKQARHHPESSQDIFSSDHSPKEATMDSESQGSIATHMDSHGHQNDVHSISNGNGQQFDQMNQVMRTPEFMVDDKDSTHAASSRKMPSIQPLKKVPSAQPIATAASENMRHNMASNKHEATAASNNNKMGFTLKVRDLIKSLAQGREQMHTEQHAQNQQEHRAEHSVNIRNDMAQAQLSPNEMNAKVNNMDQSSSMRQDLRTENINLATGVQSGDAAPEDNMDEISRVSTPLNLKVARSHSDMSLSMAGLSEQGENLIKDNQQQQESNNSLDQQQTQSRMGMMDCLRAAMGDIHRQSVCITSKYKNGGSEQSLI